MAFSSAAPTLAVRWLTRLVPAAGRFSTLPSGCLDMPAIAASGFVRSLVPGVGGPRTGASGP
eukprot:6148064-Alexandrium_andersonii.AAC.1